MTTPRPTPFPTTTPRVGVLVSFVIISDHDDEITTLPVRPVPSSPDRTLALYGYQLDYGDDSSDEDLSETAEDLDATRLQSSHGLMESYITFHLSSTIYIRYIIIIITTTTLDIIIFTTTITFTSSSRKRSRSPSPSPPSAPLPPPEHIESVGDDIETLRTSLASSMRETMILRAIVGLLEQHNVVTRDSLRIVRGRITWSELRAVYAEQEVRELREFMMANELKIIELRSRAELSEHYTGDEARTQRTDMTEQDSEASCTRAMVAEHRAEILHVSLGAAWMDEGKVANNASKKRKWEGYHDGSSSQNKRHKVIRAHAVWLSNKKKYAGKLPYCNRCKMCHIGPLSMQCSNCKWVGHLTKDCRNPIPATTLKTPMEK
nr:reverse transcriptase domain-containing protein [Tanacetum cinerariifolium]GEW84283.1 reverse transcriptase domain-containing protein [Tanacetum cinerariifolium]GEW85471.1 reverse transcriptase domain-containing protein [Tanacetum cinerariifolium]